MGDSQLAPNGARFQLKPISRYWYTILVLTAVTPPDNIPIQSLQPTLITDSLYFMYLDQIAFWNWLQ